MKKEGSPVNKEKQDMNAIGKSTSKKISQGGNYTTKKNEAQQKYSSSENNFSSRDSSAQTTSLVKYDTPFLVSTTLSNKKTLEELDDTNGNAEVFLRSLINKRGGDEKGGKSEYEDYSVKDALNKILPPKKISKNEQLWVQYVSCTPVTKAEVLNLQEGLDRRLQTMQARETGICPIREELYNECFDELIRQVTINCLERGILLMRIKKEIEMTINSYQTLYESAIAYGIRTSLIAEESKGNMTDQIKSIDEECDFLRQKIEQLELEIQNKTVSDVNQRQENNQKHEEFVNEYRERNTKLKENIKNKLSQINK